MPQGSRKGSDVDSLIECTTRLQLWDGSRLIQEHCSGRPAPSTPSSSGSSSSQSSSSMASSYPMSSQLSYGDSLAQLRSSSAGDGSHTYGTVRTGPGGQSRGSGIGSGLQSEAAYADPGSGTYGNVRSSTGGAGSSSSSASSRHYGTINYGGRGGVGGGGGGGGGGMLPQAPQQPSAPQLPPVAAPPLRLCAHASLRNSTRLTRPCDTKTESYVSSGSTLAISRLTRIATALSPASFRLRYEFVDTRLPGEAMEYVGGDGTKETGPGKGATGRRQQTAPGPGERGYGSSPLFPGAFLSGAWIPKGEKDSGPKGPGSGCHRLLRLRSSGQLPSPKNVFLYGRGGAETLSCVYRIEARPGQRIRLTMHNATFGGGGRGEDGPSIPTAPCITGSDPHTGLPSCLYAPPPPVHPLAQFQPPAPRLTELRVWEVPWDDTRLPFACFCSNLSTPGSDYAPASSTASTPATPTTPSTPITTPSSPESKGGRKDDPQPEEKDYSIGPITITSTTHVLELHFLVSKMAQWEDFNHFSFHASYNTVPSKGGGGSSSSNACPDKHRLKGSGGEIDLPPRRKKNEPCDSFPWLLEAQSQRSLFMMTWGTFMPLRPPPPPAMTTASQPQPGGTTASTASSNIGRCPTKNRLLVYTGQPPRLLRVICPTAPNTRHAAIHIFSEDWFLTTPSHPLLTPSTLMPTTTTTMPYTTPYPPASARFLKLVLMRRHYLLDPPPPPPPPTLLLRPVIKETSRHAFSYLQISRPRSSPLLLLRYDDPSHNTSFENLHQQHRQYQRQEGGVDAQGGGCGRYRCPELDACIAPELWCDGVRNCPSARDEAECPDRALQELKRDHPFLGALLSLLPHSLPASIGAPAALAVVLLLAVILTAGTACASALPCLLLWRRRRRRKGGGLEKKGMGGGRRRRAPTEELLIGAPS
ncbi:uncharacterized protein LOC124165515 [Ischnura elegans]|uniref:uncharacterized protein LOC124165515 n=1 Tax=Ischnura elegans TaxID=197161 RepID=UPI001ED895A7|nr:uncharacterized protein LOC124165515 [Ischnura elegans]